LSTGPRKSRWLRPRRKGSLPLRLIRQLFRRRPVPAAIAMRAGPLINSGTLTGQPGAPRPGAIHPDRAPAVAGLLKLGAELPERGPVVLAVDDVQYADVAPLQCLSYLARPEQHYARCHCANRGHPNMNITSRAFLCY
jgi:hypothetical protein